MGDALGYVAAVIVMIAAIVKYRSIRPARPTPAQRHLLIMLVAVVPAHVLSMPRTQAATAAIDPVPFATAFVSHAMAMVAGTSLVMMLAHALDDPLSALIRARRREATAVLLVALVVMATLLVASGIKADGQFVVVAARHPALVAYYLVFVAYMAFCTARLIALLRRFLSRPVEPLMRWGMRGVVVGAGVGQVYLAWTVLAMIDSNTSRLVTDYAWAVAQALGAICVLCLAVGSTLSVVAPRLLRAIRQRRARQALRQLTPLWERLVTTLPDVAFPQAEVAEPQDVLYRRVIEVLDAQVRLSEHISPALHAAVLAGIGGRGATDRRRAIRTEAALLAVAIDAYRAGCPATDSTVVTDRGEDTPDVLLEASRLIAVDVAMRYDPVVARVTLAARTQLGALAPRTPAVQDLPAVTAGSRAAVVAVVPRRSSWLARPWVRTLMSSWWFSFGWWARVRFTEFRRPPTAPGRHRLPGRGPGATPAPPTAAGTVHEGRGSCPPAAAP